MRKLIAYIIFFIIVIAAKAETYYVSTTGNDGNSGTITQPFLTWQHGINQLNTGDTLLIRAGLYMATGSVSITDDYNPNNGTKENPIVVMGYPGDATRPILDGSNLNNTSLLRIYDKYYWTIKRIEIRESHDTDGVYTNFRGVSLYYSNQIRLDNIIVHDIDGQGFRIQDCDTIFVRDCDSYNNYDPYNNGGKADGFQINSNLPTVSMVYFDNCRAWNNSDDGWDFLGPTRSVVDSCWAWANGYDTDGSGQGFKAGLQTSPSTSEAYIFTNNIAVYNAHGGLRANCNGQEWFIDSRWYNNTVAFNLQHGFSSSNLPGAQMNTNIWRNNISYKNTEGDWWEDPSTFIRDHNSWDIVGLTLTDDDFVSVDTTGISAPRGIDGSLPDNACYNYFMKLNVGSDLIDVGRTVGLPYLGLAPDLGAFEFDEDDVDSFATDIIGFTLPSQTGAATINATAHTVAIEVEYTADVTSLTPTIALSYGATVIPASGVSRNFTNPLPYTVTAEDGVTTQEWTVTVTEAEGVPIGVSHNGKWVLHNDKIVKL